MSQNKPLTAKQEAFCLHYVANGFNATQAAISAGYSEDTAYSQGQRLLKNVEVADKIAELQGKTVAKARKGADDVYEMAANAAFLDVRKILTVRDGKVYLIGDLDDLPEEIAILIQAIKEKHTKFGPQIEIVFVDKLKALEMLARFNGMNKDTIKITHGLDSMSDEELDAELTALDEKDGRKRPDTGGEDTADPTEAGTEQA